MNVKKRISIITALMMLLTVFAIPSLAYGETVKKSAASESGYYIGDYYGDPCNTLHLSVEDYYEVYLYNEDGEQVNPLPENWYWESGDTDIATVAADGEIDTVSRGKTEIYVKDGAGAVQAYIDVYVGNGYEIQLLNGDFAKNPYNEDESSYVSIGIDESINLTINNDFSDMEVDQSQWSWDTDTIDTDCSGEVELEAYMVDDEQKGITVTGQTRGIVRIYAEYEDEDEYAYTDDIYLYIGGACQYYAVNADNESLSGFLDIGDSQELKVVSVPESTIDQSQWTWDTWYWYEDMISIEGNTVTVTKENEDEDNRVSCYAYNPETGDITNNYVLNIVFVWEYQNGIEYKIYPKTKTAKINNVENLEDEESTTVSTVTIPTSVTVKDNSYAPDGDYMIDSIGAYALLGCKWIKNLNVPNSIKEIGQYAIGYYYNDDLERYEKYPDFTITGYSATSAAAKYAAENGFTYINMGKKEDQIISGTDSFTKIYGSGSFNLDAKTNGDGKLTYESNNTNVAIVDDKGNVTLKGPGTAVITITAEATSNYNAATKAVTIIVKPKANQTISGAASFTKAYGSKAFSLGAKTSGNGKLTYKSSNTKVAAVSSAGKVTIKGTGTATITITAASTSECNAATKKVTITVNPKKAAGIKAKAGKKQMTVSWKKDTKATGYQLTYAQNSKFTKGKKNVTISKNKTVKKTVKKLKSKKTYYVKVRAYKKVGSKKLYGSYSSVKKVKIK